MLLGSRFTNLWCSRRTIFTTSHCIKLKLSSLYEPKVLQHLDKESDDFLLWLERKAGVEISSVVSIGKSAHGRSLLASKFIQAGDCILKVPYNAQITPANLLPEIRSLLGDQVGSIAKLALVILVEQKMGQDSEWAPYISRLPQPGEMHSTIFWSESELEMIRQSSIYQETINHKRQVEKDFLAIRPALEHFLENFGSIGYEDFMHAYALVGSRAWGTAEGLSLIPFADFSNHDGVSKAVVLNDEDKKLSEVVADRNYAPGEQVLIRYGKFPNATLLLDFGFTLPYNNHDQVHIQFNIPHHDLLRERKLELLQKHCTPTITDANGFNSSGDSFSIREVRCARGKGKGIPQLLRAFARVLCCTSPEELSDLANEAAQNDGRLARRPLKNSSREVQAHQILLSRISQLVDEYNASIKELENDDSPTTGKKLTLRRRMAHDLLVGELRVLRSASAWLESYCATLTGSLEQTTTSDFIGDYKTIPR